MRKMELSWEAIQKRAAAILPKLWEHRHRVTAGGDEEVGIYPVPRGGIPAGQAIVHEGALVGQRYVIHEQPDTADVIVDDIIDSGRTRDKYKALFPHKPFEALVDKYAEYPSMAPWIEFPWERMSGEQGVEDNITRILEYIGEDPNREGLLETPKRVIKSYADLFSGYKEDPKHVFKVFEDDSSDEMVILRDIEFYSTCEHHMIPFYGKAHIAYIPDGKVIGLSKMARLLEIYTRRLQIQERISQQVTDTMDIHLGPLGSACVIEAKHMCMCARGVGKQNSSMITSSLSGVFRQPEVRAEFFSLVNSIRS